MTWRLLALHAHPDDESITMGGTLARAAAEGVSVDVVTCTLGEEGEVIGEELAGLTADRADQLGGYRYTELRSALAELGIAGHHWLGGLGRFRDSGMIGTPSAANPRAFHHARAGGPLHTEAVAALHQIIDRVRPHVLLTYDADGGYGHPDHVTAHQVAVAAAPGRVPRTLAVVRPVEAARAAIAAFPTPPGYAPATEADVAYLAEQIDLEVDVTAQLPQRLAALTAHATQVTVFGAERAEDAGFALSNRIAQPLLPREYYRVLDGIGFPEGATDLFAGLQP